MLPATPEARARALLAQGFTTEADKELTALVKEDPAPRSPQSCRIRLEKADRAVLVTPERVR